MIKEPKARSRHGETISSRRISRLVKIDAITSESSLASNRIAHLRIRRSSDRQAASITSIRKLHRIDESRASSFAIGFNS
jgi:hypothetical protein